MALMSEGGTQESESEKVAPRDRYVLPNSLQESDLHPAIVEEMRRIDKLAPIVSADPTRPVYHFRAPAGYTGDVNGPIFYKGYYHIFYQAKGFWGHARSRDLVYWEHLPMALWPSRELAERSCYSGSTILDSQGRPRIFYTSIGRGKSSEMGSEQWAAVPLDTELVRWRKHPDNPVLTEAIHGNQKVYDWRDPAVFRHEGHYFMALAGNLKRREARNLDGGFVALYRALDEDLTRWAYMGPMLRYPKIEGSGLEDAPELHVECPNVFHLGNKLVLVILQQPGSEQRKRGHGGGVFRGQLRRQPRAIQRREAWHLR